MVTPTSTQIACARHGRSSAVGEEVVHPTEALTRVHIIDVLLESLGCLAARATVEITRDDQGRC